MTVEGSSALLDAGTWLLLWKVLKHDPFGPKGKRGVVVVSEAMMDLPSEVWPVVTTRGGGRGMILRPRTGCVREQQMFYNYIQYH